MSASHDIFSIVSVFRMFPVDSMGRIMLFRTLLKSSNVPLAQLVEHLTFNQRVTGSNPVGHTIYSALKLRYHLLRRQYWCVYCV